MNKEKTIATYKIVAYAGGNIYKFYCDLSGALVCTRCGKMVGANARTCPECDTVLAPGSRYCPNCGKQILPKAAGYEKGGG